MENVASDDYTVNYGESRTKSMVVEGSYVLISTSAKMRLRISAEGKRVMRLVLVVSKIDM